MFLVIRSIPQICVSPDEEEYDIESKISKTDIKAAHTNSVAKPIQVFSVTENGKQRRIQSLAFFKDLLIVGTNTGKISAYAWYKNRLTKETWKKFIGNQSIADQNDINCFWLQKNDGILYVGCGDNNIYALDLESGKEKAIFAGHTDYVHWIDGTTESNLYSASEDGSCKVWSPFWMKFDFT